MLFSPPRILICGSMIGVTASAFVTNLGEVVAEDRVAVEIQWPVRSQFIELGPEWRRVGIRDKPSFLGPLSRRALSSRTPFMATERNHATAPPITARISGAGSSIDIRKRTTPTLSAPERDGGSYARAHAGSRFSRHTTERTRL